MKVTKTQLTALKGRFQAYLNGELDIAGDEAFTNAVQSYFDVSFVSSRCGLELWRRQLSERAKSNNTNTNNKG